MSVSKQYSLGLLATLLVLSGGALLALGMEAQRRLNPSSVEVSGHTFRIIRRVEPRAVVFELLSPGGSVAGSIVGSTDTLCEPPSIMALDMDQDGTRELVYHHCGGHGYMTWHRGRWVDMDLGQPEAGDMPAAESLWAHEVRRGGWRLLALGTLLALMGLVSLIVLLSSTRLER